MSEMHKLKPDRSVTGLLPAFFSLIVIAVASVLFGRYGMAWSATIVFFGFTLLAFVAFLRTRSVPYLASTVYLFCASFAFSSVPGSVLGQPTRELYHVMEVLTIPCIIWLVYLVVTRRHKWRGRDILELAAAPVEELGNGFTERPRPSGRLDYTKRQLLEFAEFCRRNLVALPYVERDRIYFVLIRMGKEYFHLFNVSRDYHRDTWVCFDFEGNMSVNISREDYFEYKEDLSFDRLCESLGDVFAGFLDLHRTGTAVRIIDRMNAVRVGFFS
jgi:hypothetical protein